MIEAIVRVKINMVLVVLLLLVLLFLLLPLLLFHMCTYIHIKCQTTEAQPKSCDDECTITVAVLFL